MKCIIEGKVNRVNMGFLTEDDKPEWGFSIYPIGRRVAVDLELKVLYAEVKFIDTKLKDLHGKVRITIEKLPEGKKEPVKSTGPNISMSPNQFSGSGSTMYDVDQITTTQYIEPEEEE